MEEFDCWKQDQIVCPYCGYKNEDSWEYNEDDTSAFCGSCDNEFKLSVNISVDYSTEKKEDKCQG